MNPLNSLAAVIDVGMSLEMKRSQSSQITQEKRKGRNCCINCLNLDQLLIDGKLPLRGTFVLHAPPSLEGNSLNKIRYFSISGCARVASSPGCCSVTFATNESQFSCTCGRSFTGSLLLKESDPAVIHLLWAASPQASETPRAIRLQTAPGLCRELSQVRNDQVFGFFLVSWIAPNSDQFFALAR